MSDLSALSKARKASKALPDIHPERCTGCGRCVAICPPHVLWLQAEGPKGWGPKRAVLHDAPGCTGCAKCVVHCPFDAIEMRHVRETASGPPAAPHTPA